MILGILIIVFLILCYSTPVFVYLYQRKKRKTEMPDNLVLEKGIIDEPPHVDRGDICNGVSLIDELSDRRLVFDYSGEVNKPFVFAGIAFLFGAFLMWNDASDIISELIPIVSCVPPALVFFFLAFSGTRDQFIFDRKNGMVTYTQWFFKVRTIPFKEASFITKRLQNGAEMLAILHSDNVGWNNLMFTFYDAGKLWSLLVWYMDKNRPLPPGSAFDPYRQEDYERRESERFPEPLYPSYIDTPDIGDKADRYNKYTIKMRGVNIA